MRVCGLYAGLISGVLLAAVPAFAHRPYERAVGTFERNDGVPVVVVRHYVDGIIAKDPVSIQFRLPNGSELARTPHVRDALTQSVGSEIEVYQFHGNWLPVANRVDSFDGYELREITSERKGRSILVHFARHWLRYLIFIGALTLFARVVFPSRHSADRPKRKFVKVFGVVAISILNFLFIYDLLIFEPISPLVVATGCIVILLSVRRCQKRPFRSVTHYPHG